MAIGERIPEKFNIWSCKIVGMFANMWDIHVLVQQAWRYICSHYMYVCSTHTCMYEQDQCVRA
jgi:hypothetical protein